MDDHKIEPVEMQAALLRWYRVHGRSLPWRVPPGSGHAAETDPAETSPESAPSSDGLGLHAARAYHAFVSEMMLQQTGVRTVLTYFPRFIARFPTLQALARASLDDVLYVWQGLGYYRRARQLHAAANWVLEQGHWPVSRDAWERLPGVGPYSSAMLAVLINGHRAVVMDGNIERVAARLLNYQAPLPSRRKPLLGQLEGLWPQKESADFAQALMDLGSSLCVPGRPRCLICPIQSFCRGQHQASSLPVKDAKAVRKFKEAWVFLIHAPLSETQASGTQDPNELAYYFEHRPREGLLGGMRGLPCSSWQETPLKPLGEAMVEVLETLPTVVRDALKKTPENIPGNAPRKLLRNTPEPPLHIEMHPGQDVGICIRHDFTHFRLVLHLARVELSGTLAGTLSGTLPSTLAGTLGACVVKPEGLALPTLFRKVLETYRRTVLQKKCPTDSKT